MKQKIDMMLSLNGEKDRAKALTIAAGMMGVSSVMIGGQNKDILTVIGNEVDIVNLTRSLIKKVGSATVVSVLPLYGGRFDAEEAAASMRYQGQPNYYANHYNYTQPDYNKYTRSEYGYYNPPVQQYPPPPQYYDYYTCERPDDPSCSIM